MADIGVFDESHVESYGREILQSDSLKQAKKGNIEKVVINLHGNLDANFVLIPSFPSLTENTLQSLRILAD